MGNQSRTPQRKAKCRPRGEKEKKDKPKSQFGIRKLLSWTKWLPACYVGLRISYVYFRLGDKIASSALAVFIGLAILIGGTEYAWIRKIDRFQEVLKTVIRNTPSLVICTLIAVVLLETHAPAFYYGIPYMGSGAYVVELLTADPYYLGEKHDMQIAGKKEHAHDPQQLEAEEASAPVGEEFEEEEWNTEAYETFFHCAPGGELDAEELIITWRAIFDRQLSEQHASAYRPDELEVEEANAIHSIAERESGNRTVADWLDQCQAHEALYKKYPSSTFSYYISNDYHNLLQCGIGVGASADELLLWYSKAVHYRLEYLSYEDASDCGQIVRWIAMRYQEIADNPARYGEKISGHARVNDTVLHELEEEYKN